MNWRIPSSRINDEKDQSDRPGFESFSYPEQWVFLARFYDCCRRRWIGGFRRSYKLFTPLLSALTFRTGGTPLTQPQPPITRTTHTLPFDKLSPRHFERLCLWLVEREGYERARHMPAPSSALPLLSYHGKILSGGSRYFWH
jgi:hypothetical protein